jgi:hypothetical protein
MVNPVGGPDADAQSSGARASLTHPHQQEASNTPLYPLPAPRSTDISSPHVGLPEEGIDLILQPEDSSSQDDSFLSESCPRSKLEPFWRRALPPDYRGQTQRMYVRGDGSCADGAVLLAVEHPSALDTLPLTRSLCHPVRGTTAFRTQEVLGLVERWTPDDWCNKVPEQLRQELWAERPKCSCASGRCVCEWALRTPEKEHELFCSTLTTPTRHMGNEYFHVVAGVLQIGIILLTTDRRFGTTHKVDDFGSRQYAFSMVLYASYLRRPGSRSGGVGHFETVGLFESCDDNTVLQNEPLTLFGCAHPLSTALRNYAIAHSSDKTVDHERIVYQYHGAINAEPSTAFPTVPSVSSDGLPQPLQPHADPTGAVRSLASDNTAVHRRRPISLPSRYQDGASPAARTSSRRTTRSLNEQLDQAASAVPAIPRARSRSRVSPGLDEVTVTSSASHPAPRRAKGARAAEQRRARPAAAVPRSSTSDRPSALGERALTNVRTWVRQTTNRGQLASSVHISAIPMWTVQCRSVLQGLVAALQADPMDERTVTAHLCVLWMLPQEVFTIPGRSRGGKKGRRQRHHRIHHALNDKGLIARLTNTAMSGTAVPAAQDDPSDALQPLSDMTLSDDEDTPPRSPSPEDSDVSTQPCSPGDQSDTSVEAAGDARVIQRVEHFFGRGHAVRALRCLTSTRGKANLDLAAERSALQALHPPCPHMIPTCPADAPQAVVDLGWMAVEMSYSDTGAVPGPSGFGSNFLEVLASDPACVTAMAFLIQQIVNDNLPATVRTLLTTCILVSLEKDTGGRRPVAIGDMFYRMAARFALTLVLKPAQKAMEPYQFGVGERDGCTQIVQSLQYLLTQPPVPAELPPRARHQFAFSLPRAPVEPPDPTPRPLACLSIDIANAFNSIDRSALLAAVYTNPDLARCWRTVAFGYGQPSLLLMRCGDSVPDTDAFIESRNGVRQGDPLAALLFSLAMHPVYAAIARQLHAGCYAFMDDAHGVGWLEECLQMWERLPSLLAPLGLHLNQAKCELTCFHLDTLQHHADRVALETLRAAGVKINHRSLHVLGSVVGVDDACVAQELHDAGRFRADQLVAFRRLPLLHKQTAMIALRHLTGTVLTHQLRAMTPSATEHYAAAYDAQVLQAAHRIVGIRALDGARYDEQLRWPLRIGGFGLTSANCIAPAAYLAGCEGTLRLSPVFASVWQGQSPLDPACGMYRAIEDSLSRVATMEAAFLPLCDPILLSAASASVLPSRASTFVDHFLAQPLGSIQSAVTHRISSLSHIARVTAAGKDRARGVQEIARLQALTAAESSLWLRTLPTTKSLTMTDTKWQWSAHLRLGVPVPVYGGAATSCSHTTASNEDGWHALCCTERSGAAITERHNAVLRVIAHHSRLLHVHPRLEPAHLAAQDDRRPDIQVDLPDLTLLGDVTISHPVAKTWRKQTAARGVESVGDDRETEKNDSYTQMAAALDMDFSAIVLYTYGGFHRSALSFLGRLGGALDPATCLMSLTEWKRSVKEHIAIAVQRGTADIMIRESQRVRAAAKPGWKRRKCRTSCRQPSTAFTAAVARGPLRAESRAAVVADRLLIPPTPCSSAVDEGAGVVENSSDAAADVPSESGLWSADSLTDSLGSSPHNGSSCITMVPGTPGGEVLDIVCDHECARDDVHMRDACDVSVVEGARVALDGRSAPSVRLVMRRDMTGVVDVDVGMDRGVAREGVCLFPGQM